MAGVPTAPSTLDPPLHPCQLLHPSQPEGPNPDGSQRATAGDHHAGGSLAQAQTGL